MPQPALLTTDEMSRADRLTIEGGTPGIDLMENAGRACASAIVERFEPCETMVLCGPGNNGGDGFVIARLLRDLGWPVHVALLGDFGNLKGDAALAAANWGGADHVTALTAESANGAKLVVDAIFGAGLTRDIDGDVANLIKMVSARGQRVVAVDVPSGIDGNTGAERGAAFEATLTVTFFTKKPGHLLMPGRLFCGEVITADIGIGANVLNDIKPMTFENSPGLWRDLFPWPDPFGHKYDRGHAVVMSGGPWATGAARLAARAALRAGAGLVTVASPTDALAVHAGHLTSIMLTPCDGLSELNALLEDPRKNAFVIGPGGGVGDPTRAKAEAVLRDGRAAVLDADALTSFADQPEALFALGNEAAVLTPHEGEFERLFPGLLDGAPNRLDAVREAADVSHCITLLKGPDTIIAHPSGRVSVTSNAPPWLATAGSGDVLAGLISGFMAQGVPAFEAASIGAWMHGEAANAFGPGLIAEDLPEKIPEVLCDLLATQDFEG